MKDQSTRLTGAFGNWRSERGWMGPLWGWTLFAGLIGALLFGSAKQQVGAALELLTFVAVLGGCRLWLGMARRRAAAERQRRPPPLDLSA